MPQGSFSTQIEQQRTQQGQVRLSRTQRKEKQDKENKERIYAQNLTSSQRIMLDSAQEKLSQATTLEEYNSIYDTLSTDEKNVVKTPSELKQEQAVVNNKTIAKIDEEISNAQKLKEYYATIGSRSNRTREEEIESSSNIQYLNVLINKLNEGKSKIVSGSALSFNDVWRYAEVNANEEQKYTQDKMYNRDKQIKANELFLKKQQESISKGFTFTGTIKESNVKDGKEVPVKTTFYEGGKEVVQYSPVEKTYVKSVGVEKLSPFTKSQLNIPAQEWQSKYPSEVLQFDNEGNVIAVKSGVFGGDRLTVYDYNERMKALSNLDTTLKLGEKKKEDKSAVMGIGGLFTKEQMQNNEYYNKNSALASIFGWVGKKFSGEQKNKTPKLETNTTNIKGIDGGTDITTTSFTPETTAFVKDISKKTKIADELAEETFNNYEKTIIEGVSLGGLTQKETDIIKTKAQDKFNEDIKKEFGLSSEEYLKDIKKIEKDKVWFAEKTPLGLIITPARNYYNSLEDKDLKLKGKTPEFYPDIEKQLLNKYKFYRALNIPEDIAREVVAVEEFKKGAGVGIYTGITENPRTFVFKTALWTGGVAGATVISSYTGGLGGVASSSILKWAGYGLMGLYGGTVILRTSAPETLYEKGKTFGKITAEEILPMSIGGFAGSYLGMKTVAGIDYAYYKWIKKYPYRASYKLTEMEILRGEEQFPTISPHGKSAQLKAFKRLDKNYLLPDERALIKSGKKLKVIGTHATGNRFSFREVETMIKAEGREISGMSASNKRMSINFLGVNKSPRYSFYSGQLIPTTSTPLGLRTEAQGVKAFPPNYKPLLKLKELEKVLKVKIPAKGYKYTAYLYEKGYFGTGYVAGLKPEIESYFKGGGILERTLKQKIYTRIASEKFYQSLTPFTRKGYPEFALRVDKFSWLKPSTYLDKLLMRKAGRFKPMAKGRVVPYERFEALNKGDKQLTKQIKNLLATRTRTETVNILQEENTLKLSKAVSSVSSSYLGGFKISATYPPSYATQLLFLSGSRSPKPTSLAYSKSYSIKSAISSITSNKSSSSTGGSSGSSGSSGSFSNYSSYINSSSYSNSIISSPPSYPSYPKTPSYYYPKPIPFGIKAKVKQRMKQRITPEIKGLFPDFTSKMLGLAPKEVSLKQALKEINKVQTGFEVRQGIRLKMALPKRSNPKKVNEIKNMIKNII